MRSTEKLCKRVVNRRGDLIDFEIDIESFYFFFLFFLFPSQQQDVDPTLVHGRHGWSNVAVGMPTFAPRWANVSNPTVGLTWLAQYWHDV